MTSRAFDSKVKISIVVIYLWYCNTNGLRQRLSAFNGRWRPFQDPQHLWTSASMKKERIFRFTWLEKNIAIK